ncbi:hypothetical protein, partial [Escherichia coli]|uniref:hypothetical protein n=1 Tax=Escherichia coli TaxID=562 RepID=UPI0013CF75E4
MTEAQKAPIETRLTNVRFAMTAGYLAKTCAGWSADMMSIVEKLNEPISAATVQRFTKEIRSRLDFLEEIAGIE